MRKKNKMEINDIDFEEDQQQLIEKTDIQTLASYCQELQQKEDEISSLEDLLKKKKQDTILFHLIYTIKENKNDRKTSV